MILEVLLLLVLLVFVGYKKLSKPSFMPPGSYGWPVIGDLPPADLQITKYLQKLKKKYGNIFVTKWGSNPVVFLADPQVVRKALNHTELQGRPELHSFKTLIYNKNLGVILATNETWKNNRRFLLHSLRNLGMGKTRLEQSINEEVEILVDYLGKHFLDKPVELDWSINVAVLNVIWQMLASVRYDSDDKTITEIINMAAENFEILQAPLVFLFDNMPWLQKIFPKTLVNKWTKLTNMERNRDKFFVLCREIISDHKNTLDTDNPRDIIDHYLMDEEVQNNPDCPNKEEYVDLLCIMSDLFAAGSDTTSTTLRWMILYLAINKEIQEKAQKMLDIVVPRERLPCLDDREELAYIDAIILDVLRLSSLVMIGMPHCTTATVTLEGYTIPKDTIVAACLELCHKDPQFWEKPEEFYPEHFLTKDGKLESKKEAFMPFSTGRRQCLGESLARMELFLFAAAILHRFTITPPPGVELVAKIDPTKKIFNHPKPFKVVLKKRK